ncbi:hypothetical protein BDV95DRAFT_371352 [Massariosphaeria phaeospora]|uniref:Uncharacterized protein n=1 Tax=Massariosphaeria phaeospora TaxID=100035 RepID=A0A7C8ICZ2_9PLEO|nr:hypothetical protein BDV95DRAFT_371352 [Massariosphaeria phaeospora]
MLSKVGSCFRVFVQRVWLCRTLLPRQCCLSDRQPASATSGLLDSLSEGHDIESQKPLSTPVTTWSPQDKPSSKPAIPPSTAAAYRMLPILSSSQRACHACMP